jgi:hypothetical protein
MLLATSNMKHCITYKLDTVYQRSWFKCITNYSAFEERQTYQTRHVVHYKNLNSWKGRNIVKFSSFLTRVNTSDIELIHKEENN